MTDNSFKSKGFKRVTLGDPPIEVLIPKPDSDFIPSRDFIGRDDLMFQCRVAWLNSVGELPQNFRLYGPPGVGKNEMIYHLARDVYKQDLWIMQGHEELTPEDVACTARVTQDNRVEYVMSKLGAAMLEGGICFFDEIGKVPSRSLTLLASVLDNRRTLDSVLAGFTLKAHESFRFCAALNDADAATYGLPGYIDERTRPAFKMEHPPVDELFEIVRTGVKSANSELLEAFRNWATDRNHSKQVSPRNALNIVQYAMRTHQLQDEEMTESRASALIAQAAIAVEGEE